MRELLFRGKWKNSGIWDYWSMRNVNGTLCISNTNENLGKPYMFCIPETVCQYTGFKDKNGVKIFEGDILQFEPPEDAIAKLVPVLVVFRLGCWMLVFGSDGDDEYLYDWHRGVKVIGNIHDNDIEGFINA